MTSFLSEPLINAFGWTLIHSMWQSGGIAAILFRFLKRNQHFSGGASAALCQLALVACLFLSAVTFSLLIILDKTLAVYQGDTIQSLIFIGNTFSASDSESISPMYYLFFAWLAGCGLFSIYQWRNYLICQQLRRREISEPPLELILLVQHWVRVLQISKPVQLCMSKLVAGPCVIGHFKPLILLPLDAVTGPCLSNLSKEQIELILLHELSHIQRCDYLFNLFQSFMKVFYFFNPAVLLISRRVEIERECACDDTVVQYTQKPTQYAYALQEIAIMKKANNLGSPLSVVDNRFQLLQRIQRLGTAKSTSYKFTHLFSPALSIALLSLIVVGLSQFGVSQAIANSNPLVIHATQVPNDIIHDFLPSAPVAAKYPSKALADKIEGYCVVEFVVNKLGHVENPKIDHCDIEGYFEEASLAAIEHWKYSPVEFNNQIVRVEGVRNRFVFELD